MWRLALIVVLAARAAAAQSCPGDCSGDGVVRVEELVLGVRIALNDAALGACPAFDTTGDGVVRIDELIRAASAALTGCPATPTIPASPSHTPTASPSATPTDTATPTATPTIPPVAGHWHEDPLSVSGSTCLPAFTNLLADRFAMRPCDQEVVNLDEDTVRVSDCSGQSNDSLLDRDGTIHVVFPMTTADVCLDPDAAVCPSELVCTVGLAVRSDIAAGVTPTVARYTFDLAFSGACAELENCMVEAAGAWTRLPD